MRNLIISIILILMTAASMMSQNINAIAERIDLQRYEFPQEKIHVTTDRGSYLAGDTIWLRAWVVDAASHQISDASQFVYVELVSPTNSVMTRVKIHRETDGLFQGYIPLDIEIPEGRYQLTAYTMFMQSVGAEYFYSQPVEVSALSSVRRRIVSRCVRYNNEVDVTLRYEVSADSSLCPYNTFGYESSDKNWYEQQYDHRTKEVHLTLKGKDAQMSDLLVAFDNYSKYITLPPAEVMDVSFYPEGGYLVPDVECVMTFKVHNTSTNSLSEVGHLVDAQGQVIAPLTVEHDGMGMVSFTPREGSSYSAQWRDNFDEAINFALPQVKADATVLQVRRANDGLITISAVGARPDSNLIVLQERGMMVAAGYDTVTINDTDLSPGVVQAMLFDSEWHCLSERLFFVGIDRQSMPELTTDHNAYTDREQVRINVDLKELADKQGNYAVSVIDGLAAEPSEGNIHANLLLQSELRGHINRPNYYFEDADTTTLEQRRRHLDMLMLTQGWRRYDIPRVLRGRLAEPQFPLEISQVVTGRVLSDWRKKPVVNAKVSLIAPLVEFSAMTATDSLGEFAIAMPLLPDSVDCIVMAENVKGKKQMNLELDSETFPQTYYMGFDEMHAVPATIVDDQDWRLEHSGDWRHILLNELVVTAIRQRQRARESNPYSLTPNKIAAQGIRTIDDAARALPGLVTMNGGLYTVGGAAKDRVTIYVDGEPVLENFTSDAEGLKMLERYSTTFSKNPKSKDAIRHVLASGAIGNESNYGLPEVMIAESMVSFKDLEYIYFARAPHGGGSLHIQHKKGYHAKDKKEPSVYLKITQLMGAQKPVEFYSPRYDRGDCGNAPGSDLRTTLYWNPCVTIDSNGSSAFDFYASDTHNTTYIVTVEGITSDGTPFRATHNITKR